MVDFIVTRFADRQRFAPLFSHQPFPFTAACQRFERPNMVHTNVACLLTAEFTDTTFYPRGVVIRAVISPAVFGQGVRLGQCLFYPLKSVVVKLAVFCPSLCFVGYTPVETTPEQEKLLAPGAHSRFGSGKNSQFKPER